jgi:Calx-beta domain
MGATFFDRPPAPSPAPLFNRRSQTLGPGTNSATFSIYILRLAQPGNPETFDVDLSSPTGATIANGTAIVTINNYIKSATVYFSESGESVSSEAGSVPVTIERKGDLNIAGSVEFATSNNGTAVVGTDYTSTSGMVQFAAGMAFATIEVPILPDNLATNDRTFSIVLSDPSEGFTVGSPSANTVTIDETDIEQVEFSSTNTYSGAQGAPAVLTLTRTGDTANAVVVNWSAIPGTARPDIDYGPPLSGTAYFSPNQSTSTFLVSIEAVAGIGDTFSVALSDPTILDDSSQVASLGYPSTAQVIIGANTSAAVICFGSPSVSSTTVLPGSVAFVLLSRSGNISTQVSADVYVDPDEEMAGENPSGPYTESVTFLPGETEVAVPVAVPWPKSGVPNPFFDFQFDIVQVSANATIGAPLGGYLEVSTLPYGVDPIGFTTDSTLVNEAAGTVTLTVTRTGPTASLMQTDTVDYTTANGSSGGAYEPAVAGTDYTAESGSLTFAPYQTTGTISIPITLNSVAEGDKIFTVQLSAPSGTLTTGSFFSTNTVIIANSTDVSKTPSSWGSTSLGVSSATIVGNNTYIGSNDSFETVVTSADAAPDGHLVFNMHNGEYSDVSQDTNDPLEVQIFAPLPDAIDQFTAIQDETANEGAGGIQLNWTLPSDSANDNYFEIERSTDGGTFGFLTTLTPAQTSYLDTDIQPNTIYAYQITAYDGGTASSPSGTAYGMLLRESPQIQSIGTQLLTTSDAFDSQVEASDPQGSPLTYALSTTNAGSTVNILNINSTGYITSTNDFPADASTGSAYLVTVKVTDGLGLSNSNSFSIAVVAGLLSPPSVSTISYTPNSTGTAGTLSSNAADDLLYQWQVINSSDSSNATIVDPNDEDPIINFAAAGTYDVSLKVSLPDDPNSSTTAFGTVTVTQQPTSITLSVDPDNEDPDGNSAFSQQFHVNQPAVPVGVAGQYFAATVYDQFGNILSGTSDDNNGPHPDSTWTLINSSGGTIQTVQDAQVVQVSASSDQLGSFTLVATDTESSFARTSGSVQIQFSNISSPNVSIESNSPDGNKQVLDAVINSYAGDTGDLEYSWSAQPAVNFTDNGTTAGQDTTVTFFAAGTYDFTLTVTDPQNLLSTTVSTQVVTQAPVASGVLITPNPATITTGGTLTLVATEVDQFGQPLSSQPSGGWSWTLVGSGSFAQINVNTAH